MVKLLFINLKYLMMEKKFQIGDRVTRSKEHPYHKDFNGLVGTVVECVGRKRYKIKWDKKSGKWLPNYSSGVFVPDAGQQHSTIQAKFLTKVLAA